MFIRKKKHNKIYTKKRRRKSYVKKGRGKTEKKCREIMEDCLYCMNNEKAIFRKLDKIPNDYFVHNGRVIVNEDDAFGDNNLLNRTEDVRSNVNKPELKRQKNFNFKKIEKTDKDIGLELARRILESAQQRRDL